jgi:hypothetical protein
MSGRWPGPAIVRMNFTQLKRWIINPVNTGLNTTTALMVVQVHIYEDETIIMSNTLLIPRNALMHPQKYIKRLTSSWLGKGSKIHFWNPL